MHWAIASSGVLAYVGSDKNHEAYNLGLSVSGQSSKEKSPEYKTGASSDPTYSERIRFILRMGFLQFATLVIS
jgi:hypothetical protein